MSSVHGKKLFGSIQDKPTIMENNSEWFEQILPKTDKLEQLK